MSTEATTGAASQRAYKAIRASILSGKYPAGLALNEAELAAAIGVSRTPIRQALQTLLSEELVQPGPRRQIVVRPLSAERRDEVFRLRLALEEVAVREACRTMNEETLDQLRLTLYKQQRLGDHDVDRFLDLDDDFHLGIARAAGMPLLERFLSQLRAFVRLVGHAALSHPGRVAEVVAEHTQVLEALEARDEEAAVAALRQHLKLTSESVSTVAEH